MKVDHERGPDIGALSLRSNVVTGRAGG